MQHLDDGLIQELIDGEVSSHDLIPIQAHLAGCAACQSRLDAARMAASEADELLLLLDEADQASTDSPMVMLPTRRPHWSRNLAWAASLVLAAGLGFASRDMLLPPVQPNDAATTAPVLRDAMTAAQEQAPAITAPPVEQVLPPPASEMREAAAAPDARGNTAENPAPTAARSPEPALASGVAAPRQAASETVLATGEQEASAGQRSERMAGATPTTQLRRAMPPGQAQSFESADAAKALSTQQLTSRVAREVDLPAAMRLLGGSIKLIDGMIPEHLEAAGDEVRVVYQVFWGELILSQRREGDRIEWDLIAPAGFPADSLAVLRSRL